VESWKHTLAELAGGRGAALKRHAFLLCGDDSQAEDLVQEALVRAFARPLRAPRPGAAEAYVRVIMVNLFIDGARRNSRWRRAAPLLRAAEVTPDLADQVAVRDTMLTALRSLPPRQRACVVLRYYDDLPVAKVATVLGVAEGTVKRYLSEAMTDLAARLPPRRQRVAGWDQTDVDR
jgi:RNA polymerase sigma-70 factor (sigma-E family)